MPNCLNCKASLKDDSRFCSNCGAKVVERITLKSMISEFAENVLGWDNKYFVTLKLMLSKPQIVLSEYALGVRKKYVHPFTFLIIGVTLVLFTFNLFLDDFIAATQEFNIQQINWMAENIGGPYADPDFKAQQLENSKNSQEFILKYFNLLTIVLIPIYTFFTFIVYRKPYNYAEHLVFNAYIQGTSFIATFVFFIISLLVHPLIYTFTTFITVFLYTYAYGKLYSLSVAESILKLFLFILYFIIFSAVMGLLLFAIGYISARLGYSIF